MQIEGYSFQFWEEVAIFDHPVLFGIKRIMPSWYSVFLLSSSRVVTLSSPEDGADSSLWSCTFAGCLYVVTDRRRGWSDSWRLGTDERNWNSTCGVKLQLEVCGLWFWLHNTVGRRTQLYFTIDMIVEKQHVNKKKHTQLLYSDRAPVPNNWRSPFAELAYFIWTFNDVSHCRILSPDKTEWRLISATLCGRRRCFVADQLWFMTRVREEQD